MKNVSPRFLICKIHNYAQTDLYNRWVRKQAKLRIDRNVASDRNCGHRAHLARRLPSSSDESSRVGLGRGSASGTMRPSLRYIRLPLTRMARTESTADGVLS